MTSIITFIGLHDSGKTTLATQVVSHLKKFGHSVAVVKSTSETGIIFDTPGTDTYKYRLSGADSILFIAPDQMIVQTENQTLSLTELARRYFPEVDIVIGEGFKEAKGVAKIEVVRDHVQRLRNEVSGVIAVATDLDIVADTVFRLDQPEEIASFIHRKFLEEGEMRTDRVSLMVNGDKVPMKEFVQEKLAGIVCDFIRSLKYTDNPSEIMLRIRQDSGFEKLFENA